MNDDDLAVDRRAAAAVAALDEAISTVPVPDWEPAPPARPVRRWMPAAIAASVLVALIAGVALITTDEDGDDQTAAAESTTVLAFPDPGAVGLDVVGAFEHGGSSGTYPGPDLRATVQVVAGTSPGPDDMVVEYALPAELTTLDGEPVDIGVPGAVLDQDGFQPAVVWPDGETVRFLMSARRPVGELVSLAAAAVDADVASGSPLPGHEILHAGLIVDAFPMLASNVGSPAAGYRGVAYGSDDGAFLVAVAPGSPDRWLAARALAGEEEQVEVRGRPAVIARFGDGIVEVSWLEADGTLVRVNSEQGEIPLDLLDELRPIGDQEFEALVDDFDIDFETEPPPPTGADGPTGTEVAAIETSEGGGAIRVALNSLGAGEWQLWVETDGPNGDSAADIPLTDLHTSVVDRALVGHEPAQVTMLTGLIGPDVSTPRIIDAETGDEITDGVGPLTATIEGSDHVLFVATLPAGYEDRDLAIIGTSTSGEQVRLESPVG